MGDTQSPPTQNKTKINNMKTLEKVWITIVLALLLGFVVLLPFNQPLARLSIMLCFCAIVIGVVIGIWIKKS